MKLFHILDSNIMIFFNTELKFTKPPCNSAVLVEFLTLYNHQLWFYNLASPCKTPHTCWEIPPFLLPSAPGSLSPAISVDHAFWTLRIKASHDVWFFGLAFTWHVFVFDVRPLGNLSILFLLRPSHASLDGFTTVCSSTRPLTGGLGHFHRGLLGRRPRPTPVRKPFRADICFHFLGDSPMTRTTVTR